MRTHNMRILLVSILVLGSLFCQNSSKHTDLSTLLGLGNPVITQIDPPSGSPPIAPYLPTQLTITGRNFGTDITTSAVTINGVTATILTANSTTITTTVPAGASSGLLYVMKTNGVVLCDPLNGSTATNCYGSKFYVDCYKAYNGAYGTELGITYPTAKSFAINGQVETHAIRVDLNLNGPTNVKIGCDTYAAITYFSPTCGQTNMGAFSNPASWVYQPTINFPTYYTVQMFITAGTGNCNISFP
ncbi:DNA-binding protein [Leptospira fluminis]|uniref:DNA-binding protein n=1 Tax=Leptospira fluminis TaxID=2484979 RepID=A0A4R9GTD1_9LEPT|nr:IPT/TIG domain-containing protein [Leptospira fluminis]TGK21303.1 DNA-binding protein [Leptospira fluminis]